MWLSINGIIRDEIRTLSYDQGTFHGLDQVWNFSTMVDEYDLTKAFEMLFVDTEVMDTVNIGFNWGNWFGFFF